MALLLLMVFLGTSAIAAAIDPQDSGAAPQQDQGAPSEDPDTATEDPAADAKDSAAEAKAQVKQEVPDPEAEAATKAQVKAAEDQVLQEAEDPEAEAAAKAQEKVAKDQAKQENKQADQNAATQTKEKRVEEVQEIEVAAKDPWLGKWGRFRSSTRDITTWNFKEGMFRMRFGLRFQGDGTAGSVSSDLEAQVGDIENSFKARRFRLFADGDFLRRYHFRFEYDFAADAGFKDAYIDNLFRYKLKAVAFRVGHFKEPFSLARHNSSNYNAFQEWALPVQAFAPGRSFGIAGYGNHLQGTIGWSVGVFTKSKTTDDNRGTSDLTFTGRVVGLPRYKDEGKSLVHLGLSLSARTPAGNDVSYAARPEARFAPFFIDTGALSGNTVSLADLEVAVVHGPFWVQAEFMTAHPDVADVGILTFGGAYAEVGWFLTGESRPYRKHDNTFGRVVPIRPLRARGNPFTKGSDGGAIELVGRLSAVDLNDGTVQAGRMHDLSLGINWYMTRANRVGANYIRSRVEGVGYANIILIRYQFNPGYHWPPLDPRWRHKDADALGDEKD